MSIFDCEVRTCLQRKRTAPVAQARRANLIVLFDDRTSQLDTIMKTLGCCDPLYRKVESTLYRRAVCRFVRSAPATCAAANLARLEARALDYTLKRKPKNGTTHWSSRLSGYLFHG